MIKIKGLQKSYGDTKVLHDINVNIDKEDIYGLVGVSGAGKSTLLRCINGLESYEGGSLKVNGIEISTLNELALRRFRKNIGMIFQHFSLLERKTVYENIALPMQCWGYDKKEIDIKVKRLLNLVELSEKIRSKPKELSGGQKQRVAIARALAMDPEILLCDEATSALDPNITKSILDLLRKINKELGITIIVVTHQMNVVKQVCNKMAILSRGKLEAEGKVEEVFLDNPKVLEELLGESDRDILPKGGVNIKIITRESCIESFVLSKLAIETGVEYSVVWSKYDKYRDNVLGEIIINLEEINEEKATDFLNKYKIEFRRL